MQTLDTKEKQAWDNTVALLDEHEMCFGEHWSFNFRNDPKRLGFVLSRYKFAAKMSCKNGDVLELGCSDGIGTTILAEKAEYYVGVDLDEPAIYAAKQNLKEPKYRFLHDDFIGKRYGSFHAVVSLDVVEHILPEYEELYFDTLVTNLHENGICVIGTPNITSSPYASQASQMGHVNMFSQERLVHTLNKYFYNVFPFGMNDEIMHTGFAPMAHYLLCVCCYKKEGICKN